MSAVPGIDRPCDFGDKAAVLFGITVQRQQVMRKRVPLHEQCSFGKPVVISHDVIEISAELAADVRKTRELGVFLAFAVNLGHGAKRINPADIFLEFCNDGLESRGIGRKCRLRHKPPRGIQRSGCGGPSWAQTAATPASGKRPGPSGGRRDHFSVAVWSEATLPPQRVGDNNGCAISPP